MVLHIVKVATQFTGLTEPRIARAGIRPTVQMAQPIVVAVTQPTVLTERPVGKLATLPTAIEALLRLTLRSSGTGLQRAFARFQPAPYLER